MEKKVILACLCPTCGGILYNRETVRLTQRLISYLVICNWYDTRSVKAVAEIKKVGATLCRFIDTKGKCLGRTVRDYVITYPAPGTRTNQIFMVADRL